MKIVSSLYLSRRSSDFNEIWCAAADFGFKDVFVTKYQNIVNSKWRTAAILNSPVKYGPKMAVFANNEY